MVSSFCSSCMRHISIPRNSARPNKHVCEVCKSGFCNRCGEPFICRRCLAQLDMNAQQTIHKQSVRYRGKAGGGTAMTAAGAVMLLIGVYSVEYLWLAAFGLYTGSSSYVVTCIVVTLIGLGLFIAGLSTLASSKGALLSAIRQSSTHVQSSSPVESRYARGESWAASAPAIPSSAFVPEMQPSPAVHGEPAPRGSFNPPSAGTPTSVQFCAQCGERFPDVADLKFCPGCGAPKS